MCNSRLVINLGSDKNTVQMDIFFMRIYFLYMKNYLKNVQRKKSVKSGVSEWGDRFDGVDWIFFSVSPIQFELF